MSGHFLKGRRGRKIKKMLALISLPITSTLSACGFENFDPDDHFCCGLRLFPKTTHRGCCGNAGLSMNPDKRCCDGVIFDVQGEGSALRDCCNGREIYSLATHVCCGHDGVQPRNRMGCSEYTAIQ